MIPSVDPAALEALWGLPGEGGGDLVSELITVFAEQTRAIVAALEASGSGQADEQTGRLAHRLAGSAVTLGATGIAAVARQIEAEADAHRADAVPALVRQLAALVEPTLAGLRAGRDELTRRSARNS